MPLELKRKEFMNLFEEHKLAIKLISAAEHPDYDLDVHLNDPKAAEKLRGALREYKCFIVSAEQGTEAKLRLRIGPNPFFEEGAAYLKFLRNMLERKELGIKYSRY
jgi:hypothetical protein